MRHIAFTGTRRGMTPQQRLAFSIWIRDEREHNEITLHHGMCIGADAHAHRIAEAHSCLTHGYPPINQDHADMSLNVDFIAEPGDFLIRDQWLIDASEILVAAPKGFEEERRSGTWATVRYARRSGKPVVMIWPDGTVELDSPKQRIDQ